ncbi:hypothetical protein Q4603_18515 [Zobellia galactanivorans]|uniref:hypothetical protein n=1 Tax=Zobellia galactanivorans (strain DSM 12802 / CCUG 47099 / CIP 106680 / NCIMB 13871 / Dsij) TaxID=63186 RepID=UPI0026E21A60|nr:hypothetical protein [Zobellia galactanivorans]MDO6810623.1 hypothetical protein [Zobellia galactanivorans]
MKILKYYFIIFSSIIFLNCSDSTVSKSSENDINNINNKFALGIENDLKLMNLYGHPKSIKEFKYELDENNNWIKKIRIYNEEPTNIIIREIEYYQ